MLLTATTGSENFPVGQTKVHLFFVPNRSFPGKEMHINALLKSPNAPITQSGAAQVVAAAPGYIRDYGEWVTANYSVPDGMAFKLSVSRKSTSGGGRGEISAALLVRTRAAAALRRVSFATTGWAKGAFARVSLEGRFDILPIQDAEGDGIRIPPVFRNLYLPPRVTQAFEMVEMAPETAPRPRLEARKVETAEGETVTVYSPERTRLLDI